MSWLRALLALVLVALLAVGPGLAGASLAKAPPDCPMAGMAHAAAPMQGALAAICKMQCQCPAALTQPEPPPPALRLLALTPPAVLPPKPTRVIPPEAPPPRA